MPAGGSAGVTVALTRGMSSGPGRQSQSPGKLSAFEVAADQEQDGDILMNPNPSLAGIRSSQMRQKKELATGGGEREKHWLVDSHWFETTVATVAMLNAVQIGMSIDLRTGSWVTLWKITEHVFTAIFVVEMLLKLWILRCRYFFDNWNIMDFSLVMMAVVDNWILSWVSEAGAFGELTIFRIFRLARVARVFRMVRYLQELVSLIEALIYSIKTMAWSYLLLLLLVYVYSLLCVEFIGGSDGYSARSKDELDILKTTDDWNNYQFFGTVSRSMYSLFSIITLSEFSEITRPISEIQPPCVLLLISFTCLSAFGIMNVIVGQMVQQALDVSHSLAKAKEEVYVKEQMEKIHMIRHFLEEMDEDNNADITKDELRKGVVQNEDLAQLLVQIDLPPSITIDEVFTLIDASGDGSVSPAEFESSLLRLIDCTHFHHLCLMQIQMHEVKRILLKRHRSHPGSSTDNGCKEKLSPAQNEQSKSSNSAGACEDTTSSGTMLEIKSEMSKMSERILSKLDVLLNCIQLNETSKQLEAGATGREILEDLPHCSRDKLEGQSWELLPTTAVLPNSKWTVTRAESAATDTHSNVLHQQVPISQSLAGPLSGRLPPNLLCMPTLHLPRSTQSARSTRSQSQGECWPNGEGCREVRLGVCVDGQQEESHALPRSARCPAA